MYNLNVLEMCYCNTINNTSTCNKLLEYIQYLHTIFKSVLVVSLIFFFPHGEFYGLFNVVQLWFIYTWPRRKHLCVNVFMCEWCPGDPSSLKKKKKKPWVIHSFKKQQLYSSLLLHLYTCRPSFMLVSPFNQTVSLPLFTEL